MKTWRKKSLACQDGIYWCEGERISKELWHSFLRAQEAVETNLKLGYIAQEATRVERSHN